VDGVGLVWALKLHHSGLSRDEIWELGPHTPSAHEILM